MRAIIEIVVRVFLAICAFGCALPARPIASPQTAQQQTPKTAPKAKPDEVEPPEEDESLKPQVYALNPLQAQRNITAGDFYFHAKKNYIAAQRRYVEATKWDPGNPEAFLKLGEADEKLKDFDGARDAYTKSLGLQTEAKGKAEIEKKIAKLPRSSARK